jgi:hypothetical protein
MTFVRFSENLSANWCFACGRFWHEHKQDGSCPEPPVQSPSGAGAQLKTDGEELKQSEVTA